MSQFRMSFALTEPQFLDGSKIVTRRLGWKNLKAGDCITAVNKVMGLRKGEKQRVLGRIQIVSVRFEPLDRMRADPAYGAEEAKKEGFPHLDGAAFVEMFCEHMKVTPDALVTRIEFRRLP